MRKSVVEGKSVDLGGWRIIKKKTRTRVLSGSGGTNGIDAGLRVALAPGVVAPAPGSWVTVRGHYDDPAAATCSWTYPEGSGVPAEPPEVQHRRCAERFVITSIEQADAP